MKTVLSGVDLKEIFRAGKLNLNINRQYVDNLNVFPVPDGDTGTNMNLTMVSTVKEMDLAPDDDMRAISTSIAKGALKGARGNSGVILSQIFKGMTSVFAENKSINTKIFAQALTAGANKAYDAVVNPKEGTILTVIRLIGDFAEKTSRKTYDFTEFFDKIIKRGEEVLADTPRLLPVLAKAGVVDSGGQGLIYILKGMYNSLAGIEMKEVETEQAEIDQPVAVTDINDYENITFTYCTEYFIVNLKSSTTLADIDKLRDKLVAIGDSVLVVGELDTVKVHVHTNTPNIALEYALQMGDLDNLKIENMREQYKKIHGDVEQKERIQTGVLSVASGEGFKHLFKDFGAEVMEGGQTMNPSVDDIVRNVKKLNAENVFVLPNNSNIILACEQAVSLVECNLIIIPTKNILQGISAMIAYEPDNDLEQNRKGMIQSAKDIVGVEITRAVKNVDVDGFEVSIGDIIAISDKIIAKGDSIDDVVIQVIQKNHPEDLCVIDLYYGADVAEQDALILGQKVSDFLPECDVRTIYGGQPHYDYFISLS